MPDVLAGQTPQRRAEIAEAITQFLVARSTGSFRREPVDVEDAAAGHDLFHSVGCIACHSPRDEHGTETMPGAAVSLAHVATKYSLASLAGFLFEPTGVRRSGRMPDMSLTRAEARSIGSYLIGTAGAVSTAASTPAELIDKGQEYFLQFNCIACHELPGLPAAESAVAMHELDPMRGCLSESPGTAPNFHLDDAQRSAIREALAASSVDTTDQDHLDLTMTAFNCIACHVRDEYGGVSAARDRFFTTTEHSLGNEARIPPQLTLLGAKLRTEWLQKVLFDSETVRPYMLTRMPQYGEANLGHLPGVLTRLDTLEPVEMPTPDRETEKAYRTAGRELIGDKGLNCIACHNFNGKASPGFKGMDLMTSYERLEPSWLDHFLRAPSVLRPGITMPNYWAGGEATRDDILDGDADAQIRAIWHYLSLGTSAADPPGIRAEPTKLHVTDTARTYRGRSSIAGFRGIAVGLPGGINYAFNAQTGTLTGLWRGDYVSVNWSGQGAGNFRPASRPITLAQDVSFYRLADDQDPWPLRPQKSEENPVNPDPLYPRNRGYQFKGYFFDEASVPTFIYRTGGIDIQDRSTGGSSGSKTVLTRTLRFSSPTDETVWFRALTGSVEPVSQLHFSTPDLVLTIPQVPTIVRAFGPEDDQELLLRLAVPKGESTVTLHYELLR
jgi:mono/diheme cytochrome c family protein